MLTCQRCIRTCLQLVIGDLGLISIKRRIATASTISNPLSRNYATYPTPQYAAHPKKELAPWQIKMQKRMDWKGRNEERDMTDRKRPKKKKEANEREVLMHLRYLKDPIKLAEFVRNALRDDNYDLAVKVVHEASSSTPCIVSWNHIIEYNLNRGRMNQALKCYNDMKKRAQVPDAQTYTIIFNGCSQHKDSTHALAKVLKMYNSMLIEKAPVRPNTIHLNAVLKMCARAGDMEAMFSVMDQMPKKGLAAPNNLTYTTVFNAMRMHVVTGPRDTMTPMQRRQFQQEIILHARHLWSDVVRAWRQGDMWIDDELVCAMGRILLIGNEQDHDDVLSLVEQTMNIPRQIPRKGTSERQRSDPATQGQEPVQIAAPQAKDASSPEAELETDTNAPPQPIMPVVFSGSVSGVFAEPRQNTLSLVIQSLSELHLKDIAAKYWTMFINDYNVVPDAENYHSYLRILRLSRSSTEVVNLMMKMPQSYMEAKTFRIAMSTCARDKNNRHAFANAGKILDLMHTALREPEIQALQSYLEVAMTSTAYSPKASSSGKNEPSKYEQGRQIRRALERLNPSFLNLKSMLLFRDPTLPELKETERMAFVDNILSITRRMISAYDILMSKAMVPREDYVLLTKERSKLSAFVTRHKHAKGGRVEKDEDEAGKAESEKRTASTFQISRGTPPPAAQRHS